MKSASVPVLCTSHIPCFAKTETGEWRYHDLTKAAVKGFTQVKDFPMTGTRELIAADYVYQMKRMADPKSRVLFRVR